MSDVVLQAFQQVVLEPRIWFIILLAALYGVFMGAVPGLTATMGVALIVPLTYFMDPVAAIAAVVTLVACAIFAGDIPNALLRIPGTPASAAYADDAYTLTQRGEANRALGVCLAFSVVGGLFGAAILICFARPLAAVATQFSVIEYFWLYVLGLSCAVIVSRGSPVRAGVGLMIGLFFSSVGLSAVHTQARFTFGQPELYQGINFIPAMIGLFGLSEVLRNMAALRPGITIPSISTSHSPRARNSWLFASIASVFEGTGSLLWRRKIHGLRSGAIGAAIGMLPGAGADIAAWVSMAVSKRWSKNPSLYGKGSVDGISDATTANSSALAGAWVPALVFGIPGDSVTAIVIGVLLMKNVTPGPEIFTKQALLVYSIYWIFIVANLILLPIGFAAIKAGGYLIRVPRHILLPVILLFCIVGAYATNGSYFDVGLMGAMGLLGFALERFSVPLGPVVLGIILGGPLEERFIQSLTSSGGSIAPFFSRPVAAVLGVVALLVWLAPPLLKLWKRRRN